MILKGNSIHIPLKDESVNCIVTSPPYWSLRKYDIPDLIWDEVEGCEHEWIDDPVPGEKSGKPGPNATVGARFEQDAIRRRPPMNTCGRCGAWRGQLGLEPTIDLYLKHLLSIMDECKRVLRKDGTMWVNIGDSYAGSGKAGSNPEYQERHTEFGKPSVHGQRFGNPTNNCGISPKSLCAIPERFVIAMTDRGWIRRNTIIWAKPNCMPSSVKDRFTVDFEPVYFFVKSGKYWFEQQRQPVAESTIDRGPVDFGGKKGRDYQPDSTDPNYRAGNEQWGRTFDYKESCKNGRNRRCVWTIPTQPYPESHFATFPEALVEPMIKAGCPKGGIVLDPFCGSGTVLRVAEKLQRKAIGIDLGYQELANERRKYNQVELIP